MQGRDHNMLSTAGYGQLAQPSVLFDSAWLDRVSADRSARGLASDNGGLAGSERQVTAGSAFRASHWKGGGNGQ